MNICELSDRDLSVECWIELEMMLKEMITVYLGGPMNSIDFMTHKPIQIIHMARINNRIEGREKAALEKMLSVRNLFCHYNGLSFESPEVEKAFSGATDLLKIGDCSKDRLNFIRAYRELGRRLLIRLYRIGDDGDE